jgi:toxin ParE1/3/4
MKLVRVHPEARIEARKALEWYWEESEPAALGFAFELKQAYLAIQSAVPTYPPYLMGTSRKLLKRYPYFVVFREFSDEIEVIAVAHGKRRPGYWKKRI